MNTVTSEYLQFVINPDLDEDNRNLTPAITRDSLPRAKKPKVTTRVIEISYDHLEAAIVSHLHSFGVIKPSEEVLWTEMDIELNDNGLVEIEIATGPAEKQLKLPLEDPLGR